MHKGNPYETNLDLRLWGGDVIRPYYPPKEILLSCGQWYGTLSAGVPPIVDQTAVLTGFSFTTAFCIFKGPAFTAGAFQWQFSFMGRINVPSGLITWQWQLWRGTNTPVCTLAIYTITSQNPVWGVGQSKIISTPGGAPPQLLPIGTLSYRAKRYTDP